VVPNVRYYPRVHVIAVGLGTYYAQIRGHYCVLVISPGFSTDLRHIPDTGYQLAERYTYA
jgi:hypothetical protein